MRRLAGWLALALLAGCGGEESGTRLSDEESDKLNEAAAMLDEAEEGAAAGTNGQSER